MSYMSKNWTGMIRPAALEVDTESLKNNYGKFTAKPLERGYGLTLGNSLRRVLLSSLQGAGVVAVKIDGVDHEFGTINNVKEEVSEIILNLKEIRFKISDKEDVTLVLEKNSEGAVRAGDIQEHGSVRVLNADHTICNISSAVLSVWNSRSLVAKVTSLPSITKRPLIFQLAGSTSIHFSPRSTV